MWEVDGDVVEWLESEDHDLADGGAAAFVGLGPVVVDELEGAQVGDGCAFGEEPLQRPTVELVIEDRLVACTRRWSPIWPSP
jgi:hypothetical protein